MGFLRAVGQHSLFPWGFLGLGQYAKDGTGDDHDQRHLGLISRAVN